jgi:ribosomal protein S18 acetylase RimI-like enzyme
MRATLTPIRREHVPAVAALHHQALGGLISLLGPAAIASVYRGYLASPRCTGWVAEIDGVVRGFVLGSIDPDGMRRDALRANLTGIACGVARGVLQRPRLARHVLADIRGGDADAFDPRTPELTYLAVAGDARGTGVGSDLLRAFDAALRRVGATRYEFSVEASNQTALRFYEARGLRRLSSYRRFDTVCYRYALEIPLATSMEARSHAQ